MSEISKNMKAFLDTISHSEGTDRYPNKGYNTIVGGSQFKSYADHPRKLIKLNPTLSSTAAGRYQLLSKYYDAYRRQLGLLDFSPDSQDKIAIQQIKERKAIQDIENGDFQTAIGKCCNIWASFPDPKTGKSRYGQHTVPMKTLLAFYKQCGGECNG
jgi:lysozyme